MKAFKALLRLLEFRRRKIKVWPGAYVYPTAVIGNNVSIGRGAEIGDMVQIGGGTRVGHGTFIPHGVTIEHDVFVGPNVTFTNDKYPPSPKSSWRRTLVRHDAAIGAGSVILCGIVIGRGATIGAGSVVTKSVPDGETWAGNPARKLLSSHESREAVSEIVNGALKETKEFIDKHEAISNIKPYTVGS